MEFTKESAEFHAIMSLIRFLSVYKERCDKGELDPDQTCDYRAELIEGMLSMVFGEKRDEVPVKAPTSDMTINQLMDFVRNEVLDYVANENPYFMQRTKEGHYELI